ncbi:hypothetical protein BJX76DRAFT_165097 [Aspergillus varians]
MFDNFTTQKFTELDSNSELDDQYRQPPPPDPYTHPPIEYRSNGHEPLPPTQLNRPDNALRKFLVEQMDEWIGELDEINEIIQNREQVPEDIPPWLDSYEVDTDLDSDQTFALESGSSFGTDDAFRHDHEYEHDSGPDVVENGYDRGNHITDDGPKAAFSNETISDDDSFEEQSTAIEKGWARLRKIQRHIDLVKCLLFENSDLHTLMP